MRVAFLTAGGNAPCLSASIAMLINEYYKGDSSIEFIGYLHGYKGLLRGKKVNLDFHNDLQNLCEFGGSILGNSRVKLTNIQDCINNGYIEDGEIPLEIAAQQLQKDKIDILHTIGGDDTNTTAGDLLEFLGEKNYNLTVVGLPKTIDNDIHPIKQSLGAYTAAQCTSNFFTKNNEDQSENDKPKSIIKSNVKKSDSKRILGNLLIIIITLIAIIIIVDTFKQNLSVLLPGLIPLLDNLYATLLDLKLFILDLFN